MYTQWIETLSYNAFAARRSGSDFDDYNEIVISCPYY